MYFPLHNSCWLLLLGLQLKNIVYVCICLYSLSLWKFWINIFTVGTQTNFCYESTNRPKSVQPELYFPLLLSISVVFFYWRKTIRVNNWHMYIVLLFVQNGKWKFPSRFHKPAKQQIETLIAHGTRRSESINQSVLIKFGWMNWGGIQHVLIENH